MLEAIAQFRNASPDLRQNRGRPPFGMYVLPGLGHDFACSGSKHEADMAGSDIHCDSVSAGIGVPLLGRGRVHLSCGISQQASGRHTAGGGLCSIETF